MWNININGVFLSIESSLRSRNFLSKISSEKVALFCSIIDVWNLFCQFLIAIRQWGRINNSKWLCYICGGYDVKKRKRNITDFFKKAHYAYFDMKLGDQEKKCTPRIVYHTIVEHLRKWTQDKISSICYSKCMTRAS